MRAWASIAAGLVLLVAAGCGGDDSDEATSTRGEEIPVTLDEFTISPNPIPLRGEDTYTFNVLNKGSREHALEIEGDGVEEETDTLDSGSDGTVTITLKPGTYEMYCPIGNHRQLGMEGTVVVASGTAGGDTTTDGTTTGEDGESSSGSGYG